MSSTLTYAVLKTALRALENKRSRFLVSIDDLLSLLRVLRKDGCKVFRDPYRFPAEAPIRKRSLWLVEINGIVASEIYVDTTRTIKRGTVINLRLLDMDLKENTKPELRFDHRSDPLFEQPTSYRFGRIFFR